MHYSSFKPQNEPVKRPPDNDEILDDEILFAEETEADPPQSSWKILVVDDEAEVHNITKLALSDVTFEGRSLSFLSAYSAREAQQILQTQADIAVVLLDVVMETEDAGLQLINYVREELNNFATRIILRTGQPGQAPENIVVVNYGIDDYRTKTELTARKLFITVITALRAFSTIVKIMLVTQQSEQQITQVQDHLPGSKQSQIQQLERALQTIQSGSLSSQPDLTVEHSDAPAANFLAEEAADTDSINTLQTMSMVSRLARMALRIVDGQSTQLGISQTKLAVLMYLSGEPGQCTSPSTLAKYCGVSRAAMTGLLDGLTQENYVERADHPSDRRAVMVKLTPAGQQFLGKITPQEYQLSELMEAIDETERHHLIDLVIKFIRLLNEPPEAAVGD